MVKKRKIIGYNVYRAPEGSSPAFYGFVETIDEARELAATGRCLEKSLWDTARAAGHCAGINAPSGDEADEPEEWFGDDGYDCAVAVYDPVRPERAYTVHYRDDDGSAETEEITVHAGTEDEQDEAAWEAGKEAAEEWCRGGEWGNDGASIPVYYWIEDDDYSMRDQERRIEVQIDPDHDAMIKAAGGDADCDHDWTSEGHGGCTENPGVWSTGGTSMLFISHCRECGLRRTERTTGSQKNPGEHDTVEYEQPANWCADCQSEECTCE